MKRLIYILVSILLFVSCEKEPNITKTDAPETTPQTTLMYMTGTDLAYYFNHNISAIKKAVAKGSLDYGRYLVFKHGTSSAATLTEYKYKKGKCIETVLKEYNSITSLSQEAITEVIADTKEFAPADSYNLIISGHATGWVPKSLSSSWDKMSTNSGEWINWEAMSTSPIVTRYLGGDTDGKFDISELKTALEAADTPFGYIIFDECFMSSIEALYNLRNLSDYIIASPCEIMGDGFPYEFVIPKLFANKGMEFDLQGVCDEYVDFYSKQYLTSGCIAVTVTAELEDLAFITKLINNSENTNEVDAKTLQQYERLEDPVFVDFEQYMLAKCEDADFKRLFKHQMDRAFPPQYRLHTEKFFANIGPEVSNQNDYELYYTPIEYYSGVTTSATKSSMQEAWSNTSWYKATH